MTTYAIELRMEKSIQRITQPICVRINENETQLVRAKLLRDGKPYEVQCDSAELHLLRDDGTWSHLEASVSGTSVACTIKANQLGKSAQNACAYFFFKKGTQTETTESFQVRIERAAIDTEASDAFFDASMNAIATKWGAYEAAAEVEESARQDAERKRKQAEQQRISAEQLRVQAEQARVQAESNRVNTESARKQSEQERAQAEQQRANAEGNRASAEQQRISAEGNRDDEESKRDEAESRRNNAEQERTSAEQSRQSRFNEMLDAAQNVKFRILSSNEVDSEGKPTITGIVGVIYLVKAAHTQETNHYTEWIYLENRWEVFGSTAPTAEAIELDDIDKLEQGKTIAGNRVLNATGLSALWSKLQARIQSVNSSVSDAKRASGKNASSIQALASKQSTFETQASNQLKALRTWAEKTLESKMQERYNAGFSQGQQRGGEICERALLDCNVNDFMRITERKSTSEISALIKKLSQNTKSSLLWNDPDRIISLVLPTYVQEFFKNNWDSSKLGSYWLPRVYYRMNETCARAFNKYYYSNNKYEDAVRLKKDAFYAHFGKSKIAEIAKNPSALLSLSKDDFENACYAYVCDGTAILKVNGVFHDVYEKMDLHKKLDLPQFKAETDFDGKTVNYNSREYGTITFDVYNDCAYPIKSWGINILGEQSYGYGVTKHIFIQPDKNTGYDVKYGLRADTQCTIMLRPLYHG